jgi:deoxycytidylate deaminase
MVKVSQDMIDYVRGMATHSVCKRRGVAAMVFDGENGDVIGWGVNGPAKHRPELCSGIKDKCGCAHSEVNTLLACHPSKRQLLGHKGVMLATRAPCIPCATCIVNVGYISKFIYLDKSEPGDAGIALLISCGIEVQHLAEAEEASELKDTAQ